MENWSLRENNDSPVGVNSGFVDNMQLLWKLQSLEPLLPDNDNNAASTSTANTSGAASFNQVTNCEQDLPDDDDLVDKLFRESLAMQQQEDIQNNNSLNMLLSSPPPPPPQQQNAPMIRKRSRSPIDFYNSPILLSSPKDHTSSPTSSSITPQMQQQQLYERQQIQYEREIFERQKQQEKELYERQQQEKELYERQQKERELYERQQKELYKRQQKEKYEKELYERQQKEQFECQQKEQYERQKKEQYERQQKEQYERQQKEQYERQKKEQYERQQKEQYERQQKEQYERQQKEQYERQQKDQFERQQKEQFERQQKEQYESQQQQHQQQRQYHQQKLQFERYTIPKIPITPTTNNVNSPNSIIAQFPLTTTATVVTKPKLVIPPRPQLRIHFQKNVEDAFVFDDTKDPMKPDLNVNNLRRLTVATLRTLGVFLSFEELPIVDIEEPKTTDSQQVLPSAAMQLITTMVLGTSGDKDVSQTLGSQISNGDLVALQRMIVAGLRSRNIVIHTVLTDDTLVKRTKYKSTDSNELTTTNYDDMIDLTLVKYEPPHNVTRLFLRLYRFILNMLLSTPDCWPFIQPVPETAFLYHQEIKTQMDLYTIESNVWNGKYTKFARFEKDMLLIWKNARVFHRNAGTIPKHADNLEKLFTKIVMDIKRQISRKNSQQAAGSHDFKFDPTNTLPEESDFSYPPISQVFSETSTVYAISALSPLEPKARKPKGLTQEKLLYLQLNGPFFQAVERMKSNLDGNHSFVPRFYIAKNRTLLRQIRSQGVLAIFYNTKTNRKNTKNIKIETDMILAYPASELFDIDQINECTDDFAPKGWIHLRPLRVVNHISFDVNETIERDYFRRMFATSKMAVDDRSGHHNFVTKKLLKKVVRQILGLPEEIQQTELIDSVKQQPPSQNVMLQQRMLKTKEEEAMEVDEGSDDEKINDSTPDTAKMEVDHPIEIMSNTQRLGAKEISHEVWKKLFGVCASKGIQIKNINSHGQINWNSPNSEGFFKRVYFFDDIVVQAFRQMTMYQRITEVACLMKLRNLRHMAQMREVLFNENGDVAGLSMTRYQITLKQYTHVHSHHRLSAYQKYDVIHQMLTCMKTIHEAGLAHRDLSEVNIMVNTIEGEFLEDGSEKVCLYLIDFGKAVFCEQNDVRDWFVDVPRAEWEYDGDVVPETKEELDAWCKSLPWIKGKPDHGYRMYRSIQTLPKTRSDNQVLPWLIHPQAEDMYSIGVMIWKVFTDTEPWRGILDTDLQGLRYVAEDDYRIQRALEGEVHGELSRQLLLKCLKTRPQDRDTAKDLIDWISEDSVRQSLINEWKMYSSDTRGSRRQKNFYGFDDSLDDIVEEKKKPKKKSVHGKTRGRPKIIRDNSSSVTTASPIT